MQLFCFSSCSLVYIHIFVIKAGCGCGEKKFHSFDLIGVPGREEKQIANRYKSICKPPAGLSPGLSVNKRDR